MKKNTDFAEVPSAAPEPEKAGQELSHRQLQEFGRLLRDKRNKAGFSRVQLARLAKLSDATIKFIETAKHPPSRATLIRLIRVEELNLTWDDVPGQPVPPAAEHVTAAAKPVCLLQLNCFVAPSCEPVREVAELGRVLNGAGGHVEQTSAYLDPQSAAAYVALCQQSSNIAGLRTSRACTAHPEEIKKRDIAWSRGLSKGHAVRSSQFRAPPLVLRAPPLVLRAPPLVLRAPTLVLRAPTLVLRAPPLVLPPPPLVLRAPRLVRWKHHYGGSLRHSYS